MRKIILSFILVLSVLTLAFSCVAVSSGNTSDKELDIVFTSDLHDHIEPFYDVESGSEKVGGFSRIATYINEQKQKNGDCLVLDGGDYSIGTITQSLFESDAVELRMLGAVGVDVTNLGNHEFDYGEKVLANMLNAAKNSNDKLPQIVFSNVNKEKSAINDPDYTTLMNAFDNYGVKDYTVVEKNGVKVAVFGLFGENSLEDSPYCGLAFENIVSSAKKIVEKIKQNENVDMIACVSHSGTNEDISKSEDEILAQQVPDIDLIVSGHTHSVMSEPKIYGSTVVVSIGEYGKKVGSIKLVKSEGEGWTVKEYEFRNVDSTLASNPEIEAKIAEFSNTINETYLKKLSSGTTFTKDTVIGYNTVENKSWEDMAMTTDEEPFQDFLADALLYSARKNVITSENLIAIVPLGVVRSSFVKDKDITAGDVFNILPLGQNTDGLAGGSLVCAYCTADEIWTMAEIFASMPSLKKEIKAGIAGLQITYNPNRMLLEKVTDVKLVNENGELSELENNTLYPVVMDTYTYSMIGMATSSSYGLVSVSPKDKTGNIADSLSRIVLKNENGTDLKAWIAVAEYIQSFDGGRISESYAVSQNRMSSDDDKNIVSILKNPGKVTFILLGAIALLIAFIVVVVIVIVKLVKRGKNKKKKLRYIK